MATKYYGGAGKYGASALSAAFSVSGLDEYLKKIEAAGKSIEEASKAAVNAALPMVEDAMKAGAARHKKNVGKYGTDAVYNAIESVPAKADKYGVVGSVGIDMEKHPEAIHGVYQEYGDGHSHEFPDPFVRPALDINRKDIARIERAELKKWGVPVD